MCAKATQKPIDEIDFHFSSMKKINTLGCFFFLLVGKYSSKGCNPKAKLEDDFINNSLKYFSWMDLTIAKV